MYQTELIHGSNPQAERPGSHAAILDNVWTERWVVIKSFERIENSIRHAGHVVKFKIFEEIVPVKEKLAFFPARRKRKNSNYHVSSY